MTISGNEGAIDDLTVMLNSAEVTAQKVDTGVAYHSPHMGDIAAEYSKQLADGLQGDTTRPRVTMISTVTGEVVEEMSVLGSPDYWVRNLVQPVRYSAAITKALSTKRGTRKLGAPAKIRVRDLLEIGPHSALQRPTRTAIGRSSQPDTRYHYILSKRHDPLQTMMQTCGRLWCLGHNIDLDQINSMQKSDDIATLIDLPKYPFNHAKRYWHESPMSRNTRLRWQDRHELLGTPEAAWNPLEPRWRKMFDASETPWILDHKVSGKAIYPATGAIVMAVEAARQLADPRKQLNGFRIKDATFSHPIPLDAYKKTEVELRLQPQNSSLKRDSDHYAFVVYLRHGDNWQEHCQGWIHALYERAPSKLNGIELLSARTLANQQRHAEAERVCSRRVEPKQLYQHLGSEGLEYGAAFQGLQNLAWDGRNTSIGEVKFFEWTKQQSRHDRQAHIVHPTTLDAVCQLGWLSLTQGATRHLFNGVATTRIKNAWISASGLSEGHPVRVNGISRRSGLRGTDVNVFAIDEAGELKLTMEGIETTSIAGLESGESLAIRNLCFKMSWKPDIAYLKPEEIVNYCKSENNPPVSFYQDLELLLYLRAGEALRTVQEGIPTLKPHLKKYVQWLEAQVLQYETAADFQARIALMPDIRQLETKVEDNCVEGEFFSRIARNLSRILQDEIDPVELVFNDGSVDAYYKDVSCRMVCRAELKSFLDLVAHRNPAMKILEVGAGNGSLTADVLEAVDHRLSQYDYTDISEACFANASERFKSVDKIRFKVLDLEHDPIMQGYAEGHYDLVVAAWVLHATTDLARTLGNVRRLLKPGGRLVLAEMTRSNILRAALAFGTLPSWWLGAEKSRQHAGRSISSVEWHRRLIEQGFTGIDFEFLDYNDEVCHETSIIVSTVMGDAPEILTEHLRFMIDTVSPKQAAIANKLAGTEPEKLGSDRLQSICWSKNDVVVVLNEVQTSFLRNFSPEDMTGLKRMFAGVRTVLWVTSEDNPLFGMVQGFARVISSENIHLSFATLTLGPASDLDASVSKIRHALKTLRRGRQELEWRDEDGTLLINRVEQSIALDHELQKGGTAQSHLGIFKGDQKLRLEVSDPGIIDSLRFVEDEDVGADLEPDEVEVFVEAVGVNFRDVVVILGKHNEDSLGVECSGIILQVGANCDNRLRPGDRVCAAVVGCAKTHVRCHSNLVAKISDGLSSADAASLPIVSLTAYHSLVTIAKLQRGESVLIHSGAGGTGQMAIQLALAIGAKVFATVSSGEKQQMLHETYHIPLDHIFYSRDTSFAEGVSLKTNGRGVDVVLNSLSGEGLVASWECVAPCGRFVELGKTDIVTASRLPMSHFAKNVSFSAVAIDHLILARTDVIQRSFVAIFELLAERRIGLVPVKEYSVADMIEAFRHMQSGQSIGKLVLTFDPKANVPVSPSPGPEFNADDVSYFWSTRCPTPLTQGHHT